LSVTWELKLPPPKETRIGEFLAVLGAGEKIKIDRLLVGKPVRAWGRKRREVSHIRSKGRSGEKRKRDFSLREPTHSQERMRKKKSARSVRNDGGVAWAAKKSRTAPFGLTVGRRGPHEKAGWLCSKWQGAARTESGRRYRRMERPQDIALRHPLRGEFVALLGAVERMKRDRVLVRKARPGMADEEKRGFSHSFERTERGEEEERFLSARADAFAGANAEEKIGSLRSK
jgi:hypothetical protein